MLVCLLEGISGMIILPENTLWVLLVKNPSWPLENQAAPHGKIVEHISVKSQPHPKDPLFAQVFHQTQHLRFISIWWNGELRRIQSFMAYEVTPNNN